MNCSMPGFPVPHQFSEPIQTHVYHVGDAIQLSHPLSCTSPPAFNPSQHKGLFKWANPPHLIWPKSWGFSFSISPSNKYSGLISFRIDRLDLLAVQETPKSLLQYHSTKHQFFGAQLSLECNLTSIHDYWKNNKFGYTDLCWQSNVSAF